MVLLDELEKGHPDVLNILLQIMEDGMLTDGKGRTVNFKNCILVMTSNVGSSRILEVANKRSGSSSSLAATSPSPAAPAPTVDPLRPDEVMTRLQKSPEAMSMMMEAAADPEIMRAMQTAMGGSPADLLRLGQQNPKVADFLRRLWSVLNETEGDAPLSANAAATANNDRYSFPSPAPAPKSGMDALMDNEFLAGISKQFKSMTGGDNASIPTSAPTPTPAAPVPAAVTVPSDAASVEDDYAEMSSVVKEELESTMKPELLNRIDEIVIFSPLGGSELRSVASLLLNQTIKRANEERGIRLEVGDALIEKVIHDGSSNAAQFGARPMRRAVQRFFEDAVSDAIIRGFLKDGEAAVVDIDPSSVAGGIESARITRYSDGQSIMVEIEDVSNGIGGSTDGDISSPSSPLVNGDQLRTDAVGA